MRFKFAVPAIFALSLSFILPSSAETDVVPLKMTPGLWEMRQVASILSPVQINVFDMTETDCTSSTGFDPIAMADFAGQECVLTNVESGPEALSYMASCANPEARALSWGTFSSSGEQITGEMYLQVTDPPLARVEQKTELTITRKGMCPL